MKFNTVALAALVGLTSTVVADNFANFFDGSLTSIRLPCSLTDTDACLPDSACSKNGGIGVDITNDGCKSPHPRPTTFQSMPKARLTGQFDRSQRSWSRLRLHPQGNQSRYPDVSRQDP